MDTKSGFLRVFSLPDKKFLAGLHTAADWYSAEGTKRHYEKEVS